MSAKMFGFLALLIVGLVVLSSCATLSKSECLVSDWSSIGERDGRAGRLASRINDHGEACAKHGISPNVPLYTAGRTRGLAIYCTLDNAFDIGLKGGSHRNVCPSNINVAFDVVYKASAQVAAVDSRISLTNSEIAGLIGQLSDKALSAAEIQSIQSRINDLNRDIQDLNFERRRTDAFTRTILAREKSLLGKTNIVSLQVVR